MIRTEETDHPRSGGAVPLPGVVRLLRSAVDLVDTTNVLRESPSKSDVSSEQLTDKLTGLPFSGPLEL